jgi:hypothetical protein
MTACGLLKIKKQREGDEYKTVIKNSNLKNGQ